jgi:hypothetical protein
MSSELEQKLIRRLRTLAVHIEQRVPKFVLAMELSLIWLNGLALVGENLVRVHGNWILQRARNYHGLCQSGCGRDVADTSSYEGRFCDECIEAMNACLEAVDDGFEEDPGQTDRAEKPDDPEEGD